MPEFFYQAMERDPKFRAEIHQIMKCCSDGNCKEKTVSVSSDDFSEAL